MKNLGHILTSINFIGMVVLVIILINFRLPTNQTVFTERIKVYDSTQKFITPVAAPVGVQIYTVPVNLPLNFNYDSLISLFFAAHTYSQSIQDSSIRALIFDSISQNKIAGRRFSYQWLRPVRTIESTTINAVPKLQFFGGGFVNYSSQKLNFGPSLSLKTKKDVVIGYEYGVMDKGHRVKLQKSIKW